MLTRIRVQGFKNLLDVEVELGPFTCFAGKNAVGKSNLFDAIRFVHLLGQHPIQEAAELVREAKGRAADPRGLFTRFGSYTSPEIRITADLVVQPEAANDYGQIVTTKTPAVQYEVALRMSGSGRSARLELVRESLVPLSRGAVDRAFRFTQPAKEFLRKVRPTGKRTEPFLSTVSGALGTEIHVHQEGHGGRKVPVPAPTSSRTALAGHALVEFPTLLAVHRELASWKTLLLEPSAMRMPSEYRDPQRISATGANVPATLDRLATSAGADAEGVLSRLANQLADLVDDVQAVRLRDDERAQTLVIEVQGKDGIFHPASSLSDGTLRFLVLATFLQDSEATGLLCLEEPENGIHPSRILRMINLLRDLGVDPTGELGDGNPLRQVVVNTHSPAVMASLEVDELVYVNTRSVQIGGSRGEVAHLQVPPGSWRATELTPDRLVTRGSLTPYVPFAHREPKSGEQLSLFGFLAEGERRE
jgi:predicted ATPase